MYMIPQVNTKSIIIYIFISLNPIKLEFDSIAYPKLPVGE